MQFRYKIETFRESRRIGGETPINMSIGEQLNAVGSLGWELISCGPITVENVNASEGTCERVMRDCVFKMEVEYR